MKKSLVNFGEKGAEEIEITDEKIELKEHHIDFVGSDLFLALHGVRINLNGNKNEYGTWNLKVEIKDKYDYTDFRSHIEYVTFANSRYSCNYIISALDVENKTLHYFQLDT